MSGNVIRGRFGIPPLDHQVAYDRHDCRFGDTVRPVCLDCDYKGPLTTPARARAMAAEHQQKSAGIWRPAK